MTTTTRNYNTKRIPIYDELYKDEFTKVYYIKDKKTAVCKALKEYIPIEDFKKVFHFISLNYSLLEGCENFLFDKRNLRVFHQPSMEWYFIFWKQEMYSSHQLKNHFKILPKDQPSFNASVAAGRALIEKKYTNTLIKQLNINYIDSIEEL